MRLAFAIYGSVAGVIERKGAPDTHFLESTVAATVAAVAQQTRKGLTSTRRTGGRIVTPFIQTLPTQHAGGEPSGTAGQGEAWGA